MSSSMKIVLIAASGVSTLLVGCSSSSSELTCNSVQCPSAQDYCCAGTGTSKCMLISDVNKDGKLQCGVTNGETIGGFEMKGNKVTRIGSDSDSGTTTDNSVHIDNEGKTSNVKTGDLPAGSVVY